ncbi:MAG TPA: hypothetical protein EYP23_05985 [Thermoplasmata archaeon]|nr:hypothetical protein [Thermoplasmata archaeon]
MRNADDLYKRVSIPKLWRDYDFEKDGYAFLSVFNLPITVKHEQTVMTAGVHLIGLTTAFTQAFSRLTNSIIGKIFVRKNEWEIANLVLAKFLGNMGEKFAELVASNNGLKEKDSVSMIKTVTLYLNNFNMKFSLKKLSPKESRLVVAKDSVCPYVEAAKRVDVEEKIDVFVCKHFYDGISNSLDGKVSCECINGKCNKDDVCEFVFRLKD